MKPVAAFFLLAIPFGITAVLAAFVGVLVSPWYGNSVYATNLLRAADKYGAAFFGLGDGSHTVSAECGSRKDCKVCILVCMFLDLIQKGHCKGAAKKEGLSV